MLEQCSYYIIANAAQLQVTNCSCTQPWQSIYMMQFNSLPMMIQGHKAPVTCILYNYNDTSIASASKSGEIILHNTVTDLMTKLMTTLKLQASL